MYIFVTKLIILITNMKKEEEIEVLTEYIMLHMSDLIPYNTPNYDEVLLSKSKQCAESYYEYMHNYDNYKEMSNELLDIDLPW